MSQTTFNDWAIDEPSVEMLLTDTATFTIIEPTDTASITNSPNDGYTLCGPRLITVIDTSTGITVPYSS